MTSESLGMTTEGSNSAVSGSLTRDGDEATKENLIGWVLIFLVIGRANVS